MDWSSAQVLITGGTGSLGKKLTKIMMEEYRPARLIVFSRDELKQHEMRQLYSDETGSRIRYFIGDVRDRDRLMRAMNGVTVVIHAAALKQVPACEYNPMEAILTNIIGGKNVIEAAIDSQVERVIALSTDKAVNPVNLYGATKLCAEKLFIQSNSYARGGQTMLSCVRYGNVVGSRGSVIPVFKQQRLTGEVTVTDDRMTRFWLTLDQAARFVIRCVEQMHGGEVFIPKIPSMKILDLARAVAPECAVKNIGIRPGEKLHEALIGEDEARSTVELDDMFVIRPAYPWWKPINWSNGKPCPEGFHYTSDFNSQWLTDEELRNLVEPDGEPETGNNHSEQVHHVARGAA